MYVGAVISKLSLYPSGSCTSAELATIISDETGSGSLVFATSPTLVTPVLGVATATSINGTTIPSSKTLVVTTDKISVLAATTSSELAGVISDETGSGSLVFATSPTLVTPLLGTPTSGTLTNCAGLPISSGVSGLGTGIATFLATPSSANLAAAVTNETGSGLLVFDTSPTIVTPTIASFANATHTHQNSAGGGQLDHGAALTGLSDDDHTQYALLAGRSGGQSLIGGTAAGDDLTLTSTSNGTKGNIYIGGTTTLSVDEVNGYVGIGDATPDYPLDVTFTNALVAASTTSGGYFTLNHNPASASAQNTFAIYGEANYTSDQVSASLNIQAIGGLLTHSGTGTVGSAKGAYVGFNNTGSGTTTVGYGGDFAVQAYAGTISTGIGGRFVAYTFGGTMTSGYAGYFDAQRSTGTFTTAYAGYFNCSGATTNYAIYVASAQVSFQGSGVLVGAATGGDKGAGTINVSGNVYKNNTAYTNPDYVFEHYYTGKIEIFKSSPGAEYWRGLPTLNQVEMFVSKNLHLPTIPRTTSGIFDRSDMSLELHESTYLYLFDHERRISALEKLAA